MFAKLFKVRVEKFYMFFNYKFHLFSTRDKWFTRIFPYFKDNETEYGIGWIPLGGYVKIAGMIDESMDTEQMQQPAKPDEFRAQKVWKRFFIMFGGVLMNFITAWVIYSAMLFFVGRDYLPIRNVKDGFQFSEGIEQLGFRLGDIPVAIDGDSIVEYNKLQLIHAFAEAKQVTVLREGQEVQLTMPEQRRGFLQLANAQKDGETFITYYVPAIIDSIVPGSNAEIVGLQAGSTILSVNGHDVVSALDVTNLRETDLAKATAQDSAKWKTVNVICQTAEGQLDTLQFATDTDCRMGVVFRNINLETGHQSYNIIQCIPAGLVRGWDTMVNYVSDLRYVASKEGAQSVGSFVTIGSIFPDTWNWLLFWTMTAFISIILAVMNILPIPGLDGGHIVILIYEAITGREPSEKVMEWIERIGIGLLVALMLLAMSNDIRNFILPLFGL